MLSGNCVAKTDSTVVEIISVPDFNVSFTGETGFCAGTTRDLHITPALSSGFSYQWFEVAAGPIAEATFDNYTVSTSGTYYAVVTSDNAGCAPQETEHIQLMSLTPPTPSFQVSESACVGEEIAFVQQSTGDGRATMFYQWTFGDGTNRSTGLF
jgi:hypothetical protein